MKNKPDPNKGVSFSHEDRQLKGLQDKGQTILRCNGCSEDLLVLQLVTTNDASKIITRVVVECGLCGGLSDIKQVVGQFYPGAVSDEMCFDIIENPPNICEADVVFRAWQK